MKVKKIKAIILALVLTMIASSVTVFAATTRYSFSFPSSYDTASPQNSAYAACTGIAPTVMQDATTSYTTTYYVKNNLGTTVTNSVSISGGNTATLSHNSNHKGKGSVCCLVGYPKTTSYYRPAYTASGSWLN